MTSDQYAYYYKQLSHIPVITAEEERRLLEKYKEHGCKKALHKLVAGNLRFVVNVASKFNVYNCMFMDIIQEGNVGLIKAIDNFDIEYTVRITTIAEYYIRREIILYLKKYSPEYKICESENQRKLYVSWNKVFGDDFDWYDDVEIKMIAKKYKVSVEDIYKVKELKEEIVFIDYDEMPERASNDAPLEHFAMHFEQYYAMYEAFEVLNERQQFIIKHRYMTDGSTLAAVGEMLNISPERVRQIERGAIRIMKNYIEHVWTPLVLTKSNSLV